MTDPEPLSTTPLNALHRALGAKMVAFAGYAMPLHYPAGIMAEHLHTRKAVGLFDVSHMGQLRLVGPGAVAALEQLVPGDIAALKEDRMRYTMLTDRGGGILDDLMVVRRAGELGLVVNAGTKLGDVAHISAHLPRDVTLVHETGRALLALQGPEAATVLARLIPGIDRLPFMSEASAALGGIAVTLTRSGYTGEDGYEISVPGNHAESTAELLLDQPEVLPIGLGARDSLRLEAGLCLHGHDIDETTTPVEAALTWTISKRRRTEGGFPGDDIIARQLQEGPSRLRVGLLPDGRAPAREGAEISNTEGRIVGKVTSGGFGPSAGRPVAMAYVETVSAIADAQVDLIVRGKPLPARIAPMPFVPHRYAKP